MSPRQLLEKLEELGVIDPRILKKIRAQVEDPDRNVKTKSVLSYLVKKEQITQAQAVRLLKSTSPEQPKKVDEFEVKQPVEEKSYDTDDLTGIVNEPDPEPAAPTPAPKSAGPADATVMDEGQFDVQADVMEVQPMSVPSQADQAMEVDVMVEEPAVEAFEDYESMDRGAYPQAKSKSSIAFVGKKNLKDQWATKWLYIGFGLLGFLIIIGAVLAIATGGVKAEDQFKAAMESFEKLAFQDAIGKFEQYIEDNPKHKHVPTAKARRVQSIMASSYVSRNWVDTISAGSTYLPELEAEEDNKLEVIRDDLAVMLPRSLFEITEKAKQISDLKGMEQQLEKIAEYRKVVDNPVYIPSSQRNKPTTADNLAKIENNIRMIEGQIEKEKEYKRSLVMIQQLGEQGKTDEAFARYRSLTRNYGDLANREELRNTMKEISLREQELVQPVETSFTVSSEPRPTPITSSVVLATRVGEPVDNLKAEIVNYLAEGSVYGINAGDGTIAWRRFVGFETQQQPQSLDQDSVLVVNQQKHELLRLEKQTGNIIWRTEIGEPFVPPSFNDNHLVVTTDSGKIILLNRQTGETESAVALPQQANVGALVADRDPYIYQPGSYSNLYVLSNQDLSCKEVFYLGHYQGSISIPPQYWSGYILVAVNRSDDCDLFVLKPAQNGLGLELVQILTNFTNGIVSTPMRKFGRSMLVTADNGEIRILELDPTNEASPISRYADNRFDNSSGQPAWVLTEGSNLWIAGKGISRFRIKRTMGQFDRNDIIDHADTFIAPLKMLDDNIIHISRRAGSGMLTASLVDSQTLQPIWRTDFGGQLVGPPVITPNGVTVVSNQGDLFRVDQTGMQNQYYDQSVRASTVVDDLTFTSMVQLDETKLACIAGPDRADFIYADAADAKSKLMQLTPPADRPAVKPLTIGGDLIVPSTTGQIVRIDPSNGRMVGTPFQPPISPGSTTEWFEGTVLPDGLFAMASGAGADEASESVLYVLDASDRNNLNKVGSISTGKPFKSRLINDGNAIYGVLSGDTVDGLFSVDPANATEISRQSDLPGRAIEGPWITDSGILLRMDSDHFLLMGTDLQQKWSQRFPGDSLAGKPQMMNGQILLTFQTGLLKFLDPTTGEVSREFHLDQPVIHAPVPTGQSSQILISGLDGTLHQAELTGQ